MLAEREASPPTPQPPALRPWKCWRCGRMLARIFLLPGCTVEVKCGSCNAINLAAIDKGKPKD
jgi:LSD1 subclass zinc finger protein